MSRNGRANDLLQMWKDGDVRDGIDYGSFDSQYILESIEKMDTTFCREKLAALESRHCEDCVLFMVCSNEIMMVSGEARTVDYCSHWTKR